MKWLRSTITILKALLLTLVLVLGLIGYCSVLLSKTCSQHAVEYWLLASMMIILAIQFLEVVEILISKICCSKACLDFDRRQLTGRKNLWLIPCQLVSVFVLLTVMTTVFVKKYFNFTECFWRLKHRRRDMVVFIFHFSLYLYLISMSILLICVSYRQQCFSNASVVTVVALSLLTFRLLLFLFEFLYYDMYLPKGVNRQELSQKHGRFMRESELGAFVCLAGEKCLSTDITHILKCHEKLTIPKKKNNYWYCFTCRSDYLIGFHQTSPEAALAISKSDMRAGDGGLFGGGIYFARCIEHTEGKAHQKGALICALVHTGAVKMLNEANNTLNLELLKSQGFDSVYARARVGFLTRDEFVVYSSERVKQWIIVYPS